MSRRGISIPLRVCGSGVRGIPPGSVGDSRWFSVLCAPCLANWGGGGLSHSSLLCGGRVFCVWGELSRFGLWAFCLSATLRGGEATPSGSALRVSARTLSAAKQGGAERPGDGCPCVSAEEVCSAPSLDGFLGGGDCRLLACCLPVGWCAPPPQAIAITACRYAKARRSSQSRSGQTLKLTYRTGQICVTNSRKSFTSLPCSSRPVPYRVATSALSAKDSANALPFTDSITTESSPTE